MSPHVEVCVFHREPNDPQSAKDVEKMFTVLIYVDKWPVSKCTLCGKTMDGVHEAGRDHQLKINELACCNEMFGVAKSRRRFEPVAGGFHPAGLLTKQGFRNWCGQTSISCRTSSWMPCCRREPSSRCR